MKLYPGQKIHGFRLVYKSKFDDKAACCNVYIRITLDDLECFRLAKTLHNERKSGWSLPMAGYQMHSGWKGMLTTKMPVASSAEGVSSYFPSEGRLTQVFNEKAKFISWAALMAAGSIYGVVHLIAWNGPFKTETQRWMWRTSCFIIASPIVLLALVSLVFAMVYWLSWLFDIKRRWIVRRLVLRPVEYGHKQYNTRLRRFPKHWQWKITRFTSDIQWISLPGTFALVYVAARVYLLVKCFIELGFLPVAVYQEPDWSKYIPHFGSGLGPAYCVVCPRIVMGPTQAMPQFLYHTVVQTFFHGDRRMMIS
jgi:hypothetical protein